MRSYALRGAFTVPVPPGEALRLFTPRGERDWAAGWEPAFPVPVADDAAPGTVFHTDTHGARTVWVVTERTKRSVSYAQVRPDRAGTVRVALAERAGASEVTVEYHLTPLSPSALPELARFAANYPAFLDSWRSAIGRAIPDGCHPIGEKS